MVEPVVVEGASHRYGEVLALDGVSFALSSGVTALVGVNGAGKSTLLSVLAGALRPTAGRVSVYGLDPYDRRQRRRALASVALMPQLPRFPGNMSAQDVVEYLAWMRGLRRPRARAAARSALDHVGLAERANSRMRELSGGMARRVALAQALASDADVLLLDEPSTGLDPVQRRLMVELIGGLDRTVLMSSHMMEDVADLAEDIVVLHEGKVRFDGELERLTGLAPPGADPSRATEMGLIEVITKKAQT